MIVLLNSRHQTASQKDFAVLERIFRALGIERGDRFEEGAKSRTRASADFWPALFRFQLDPGRAPAEAEFFVQVSDPLLALQIVKQNGGEVVAGLSDEEVALAGFRLQLPSGARIQMGVLPSDPALTELPGLSGSLDATGKRFGIVVSRFNAFITERLLQGAHDGLVRSGARRKDIVIVRVPGAFEIPSASRTLAETTNCDAILCIGCLLRGDTAHYDVIVNEVTRGIGQSAQETGVPHAFGVLTCDTLEQAIDRAGLKMGNKGLEAAMAAVEMANLGQSLRGSQRKVSSRDSSKKKPSAKKTTKLASQPKSRRKKK
jgi:6,7-dimethyl-8-ribityllumazine synthase